MRHYPKFIRLGMFTPDSKMVYVSDSAARLVSVIDAQTLKEVARIPVGEVPKRIKTLVLQ